MIYFPQIKTTPSELKAFSHLRQKENNARVIPVVQLTKPRVAKTLDHAQTFENHLERIFKVFGDQKRLVLDITGDTTFQDAYLSSYITDSSQGYLNWVNRVVDIKHNYNSQIIPSLVGSASPETMGDLQLQAKKLLDNFDYISLRLPIQPEEDVAQLEKILDMLGLSKFMHKVYMLFDYGSVKTWETIKESVLSLNQLIEKNQWESTNVILLSSCPSNFPINGRSANEIEKCHMAEYNTLKAIISLPKRKISYGDYAFIHPKRNESAGFWLPRIDYPADDGICYYVRSFNRKASRTATGDLKIETLTPNDKAYRALSEAISNQDFFTQDKVSSWGRDTIKKNVTEEEITGKSPQHYIAIRANIHMERVLSFLNSRQ